MNPPSLGDPIEIRSGAGTKRDPYKWIPAFAVRHTPTRLFYRWPGEEGERGPCRLDCEGSTWRRQQDSPSKQAGGPTTSILIELTPDYRLERARWRRTWGYEPKREDILKILAKKQLQQELRRLFNEFRVTYDISGHEFREVAEHVSQTTMPEGGKDHEHPKQG
jgi:hypothetical protein